MNSRAPCHIAAGKGVVCLLTQERGENLIVRGIFVGKPVDSTAQGRARKNHVGEAPRAACAMREEQRRFGEFEFE